MNFEGLKAGVLKPSFVSMPLAFKEIHSNKHLCHRTPVLIFLLFFANNQKEILCFLQGRHATQKTEIRNLSPKENKNVKTAVPCISITANS